MVEDYGIDLPDDMTLTHRFNGQLKYWSNRNKFIVDVRNMLNGMNQIEMPVSTQYKVRILHTYIMASLINEKISRYLASPVYQIVSDDDLEDDGREKSSRIEQGLNVGNYEISRKNDADVWNRQVLDAILLDEGVSKTLRTTRVTWKELVKNDGQEEGAENKYPLGSKARENYKKEKGVPLAKYYVPLEYYYPVYDGPELMEQFELVERSLLGVLSNPLYRMDSRGEENLKRIEGLTGPDGGANQTVNLVEYMNNNWHCYYLAGPGINRDRKFPRVQPIDQGFRGNLMYLYGYEHEIERSQYTSMGGRFGGWKTNENRIEGVGKGILELSQAADEIVSQILTNVRAKYWPSLNFKLDPSMRGYSAGESKQEAPKLREGEAIVTYLNEEIAPIFRAEDDPMAMWLYDQIQLQISKLGASPVLYGGREPGVDTGYHQALQTTQAESLDEKLEQNISAGANQDALLFLLHVKKLNEDVYMHYTELNEATNRKVGKYVKLDPEDLTPMPRIDSQVQKPRPVDYLSALRLAKEASDDRQGKGPLFSDDTIHEKFLGTERYDVERKKILVESQKREVINSGVFAEKVGEAINIKLAKVGTPEVGPEMLAKADPELLAAIQSANTASQGGTDPELLAGISEAAGIPSGPVSGDPEDANRLGEAVLANQQTGASI